MTAGTIALLGCGMYAPAQIRTNADLEKLVDTSDTWIRERTGIRQRHIAAPDETSASMGIQAAQAALHNARISASQIDLVIVATSTPDYNSFPATACLIQDALGTHGGAFDLSAACSGFVYALATASSLIEAGTAHYALVIGTEVFSRIIDWTDRGTCILFGDGAGAVVIGRPASLSPSSTDIRRPTFALGADGAGASLLIVPAGGGKLPATVETITQRLHYVKMEGPDVFKFGTRILVDAVRDIMQRAEMTVDDISWFVPHHANGRMIEAATKRLAFPTDRLLLNIAEYGNTSAASIPLALAEAVARGDVQAGHQIMMVGFGGGLTWASGIMEWAGSSVPVPLVS